MRIYNEEELADALQNKNPDTLYILYNIKSLSELDGTEHLKALLVGDNHVQLNFFPSINSLTNLETLNISCNEFKTFPSINSACLSVFYATNNKLTSLPCMDLYPTLPYFRIRDNRLRQIPEHIKTIPNYLSHNKYPKWLNYRRLVY